MADMLCADLSNRPVASHLSEWLAAVTRLEAVGELAHAQLLLETVLQAHEDCAEAYALLVHTHLQLGDDIHLLHALQVARCADNMPSGTLYLTYLRHKALEQTVTQTIQIYSLYNPGRQQHAVACYKHSLGGELSVSACGKLSMSSCSLPALKVQFTQTPNPVTVRWVLHLVIGDICIQGWGSLVLLNRQGQSRRTSQVPAGAGPGTGQCCTHDCDATSRPVKVQVSMQGCSWGLLLDLPDEMSL